MNIQTSLKVIVKKIRFLTYFGGSGISIYSLCGFPVGRTMTKCTEMWSELAFLMLEFHLLRHTTKIVLFLGFGMDPKVEIPGILGGGMMEITKNLLFSE